MRIVHQSAPFSHFPLPDVPLLTAPKIAGLISATTPRQPEIILKSVPQIESIWSFMATFRTREQLDAEIAVMAEEALFDLRSRRLTNRRPL
jgi:hypothetical protein